MPGEDELAQRASWALCLVARSKLVGDADSVLKRAPLLGRDPRIRIIDTVPPKRRAAGGCLSGHKDRSSRNDTLTASSAIVPPTTPHAIIAALGHRDESGPAASNATRGTIGTR